MFQGHELTDKLDVLKKTSAPNKEWVGHRTSI